MLFKDDRIFYSKDYQNNFSQSSENRHVSFILLLLQKCCKNILNIRLCVHMKVYLQDKFLELEFQSQRVCACKFLCILTIAFHKYCTNLHFYQQYIKVNCIFQEYILQGSHTRTHAINKIKPCRSFEQLIENRSGNLATFIIYHSDIFHSPHKQVGYDWHRKSQEPEGMVRVVLNLCFAAVLSSSNEGGYHLRNFHLSYWRQGLRGPELQKLISSFYLLNEYDIITTSIL